MHGIPICCTPSGSHFFSQEGFFLFLSTRCPLPHSSPSVSFLWLCPLVFMSPCTCQTYCLPQEKKKSKPTQASFRDLFNGHLLRRKTPLFLELFLPGFGAASMSAFVFPLKEAWFSLLCRVWLWTTQGRSKTWTLLSVGTGTRVPSSASFTGQWRTLLSLLFVPFHWARALLGPLSFYLGAQYFCVHSLIFVCSTYNMPPTSILLM